MSRGWLALDLLVLVGLTTATTWYGGTTWGLVMFGLMVTGLTVVFTAQHWDSTHPPAPRAEKQTEGEK